MSPTFRPFLHLALLAPLAFASTASAATIAVNSTLDTVADEGFCTLREALLAANTNLKSGGTDGECVAGEADPAVDVIAFAIKEEGVQTIMPLTALPAIVDPVVIDGYTQEGARPNELARDPLGFPRGTDAVILIEIDGSLTTNVAGLHFVGGSSGSEVRGLAINRFGNVVVCCAGSAIVVDAPKILVQGNFVAVEPDGTTAAYNGSRGIYLDNDGDNVLVGGDLPEHSNLVGRVEYQGIQIGSATDSAVVGNIVGLDRNGAAPFAYQVGISVSSGVNSVVTDNFVGGASNSWGISLDTGAHDNVILRNRVGDAAAPIQRGVVTTNSASNFPFDNLIENNQLSAYSQSGVVIARSTAGLAVLNHVIRGNSFDSSLGIAIDLGPDVGSPDGVSPNDAGDLDGGPNGKMNFPVLGAPTFDPMSGLLTVPFDTDNPAGPTYTVEMTVSESCAAAGNGPRRNGVPAASKTGVAASGADSITFAPPLSSGFVSATSTGPEGTSEFSQCVQFHTLPLLVDGFED